MKRVLVMGIAVILALSLVGTALAAGPVPNQRDWVNMVTTLELSDKQAEQMRSLQADFHQEMKTQRAQLQDILFELRQMQFDRQPDMQKVQQKIQEANSLRAKMREQAVQHRDKMRSVLTPEQQQKWNQICPRARVPGRMGQ